MANCHNEFVAFNGKLNLSRSWFNRLKSAKSAIEKQLHRYFDPLPGLAIKRIRSQGSKKLATLIRRQNGTVDFDYGIYFYPKPKVSAAALIDQVYQALYGLRTFIEPQIKRNCIQVTYSEKPKIHFDVPIYYLKSLAGDLVPRLATKRGWVVSNPAQFEKWYSVRFTPQLTRIVRYVKAWSHNQSPLAEMPKGVALTVLVATHYFKHERDDVSLVQTLIAVEVALTEYWTCRMPDEPFDNLLRRCCGTDKKIFLSCLDALITDGQRALNSKRKETGLSIWHRHLGPYFLFG